MITLEQEPALKGALKGKTPLSGWTLESATIDTSRVLLRYAKKEDSEARATLSLVHPSQASEKGLRLRSLVIEPSPGPAPPPLIKALADRLEAAKGLDALWTKLAVKPEEVARPEEPKGPKAKDPKADAVAELRTKESTKERTTSRPPTAKGGFVAGKQGAQKPLDQMKMKIDEIIHEAGGEIALSSLGTGDGFGELGDRRTVS